MPKSASGNEGELADLRRRVAELESELGAARNSAEARLEPLAAREALLAQAEKSIHLGSWFFDPVDREVKWSEELYHILGYDSRRDKPTVENYFAVLHPEDRDKVMQDYARFLEGASMTFKEYRLLRRDGSVRDIVIDNSVVRDEAGNILQMVGTVLDVTERKHLERQLRQGHKMEAVGRLAAGVAHDFNNLLSVIGGNADLLLERLPDERLRRIREAAEVGAALTRQLLAFSRQGVVQPVLQDLGEVVRDTVRILERLIGEHISIRLDLSGESCALLADRAQLQQILLNLCINARDAMPGGGPIRIAMAPDAGPDEARDGIAGTHEGTPGSAPAGPGEASPARREAAGCDSASWSPAGNGQPLRWIRLSVEDTGSGMDEATRTRAFEPFFTTKEPGKGTGLGLNAVLDAVTQAGGRIAMESAPGKGTRVSVLFPRRCPEPKAAPRPGEAAAGGGESILVVEDHPALRELVRCFLADAGYRVQVVGRPGEAESLWEREQGAFDLLVTDMVMPEKSGRALAAGLQSLKPSLKTLFISGYSQGMGPEKLVEGPYLQKPFTRLELLRTVRAIFDAQVRNGKDHPGHAPDPAPAKGVAGAAERSVPPAA